MIFSKKIKTAILILAMFSVVLGTACRSISSSPAVAPIAVVSGLTNHVEVILFYSLYNCECMQNGKIWVETTINTDYQTQVAAGKLVYRAYDADEPSNEALKQRLGASGLSLYFSEVRGADITTGEFKSLWLYLDASLTDEGLKAKFISVLKKEIDKHLAGF